MIKLNFMNWEKKIINPWVLFRILDNQFNIWAGIRKLWNIEKMINNMQ